MFRAIANELKEHAPFTIFGALSGALLMVVFQKLPQATAHTIFYVLHPMHVVLSALVTASMYSLHKCKCIGKDCIQGRCNFWLLLIIGYVGAIGIATLSDSLIPYWGETLLNMPQREAHIGFIEKWWLIHPLAIIGVAIAYRWPATKVPHAGHVLLSTWASLFHMVMAGGQSLGWSGYMAIFFFLFLAVWLPCCVSDIVFPLLFVKESKAEVKVGE